MSHALGSPGKSAGHLSNSHADIVGQFLSTLELPPTEFLDELHRLMDPFVLPSLVRGSSPPSGKVHLPPALSFCQSES